MTDVARTKRRRRWLPATATGYLVLLTVSCFVRTDRLSRAERSVLPPGDRAATVPALARDGTGNGVVRLAYVDLPSARADAPVVLLLHGSPGTKRDFRTLAPALVPANRVIAPDLPGFGRSSRHILDYSIRTHARYVLSLLDLLGLARVHVVGFSMGGGVALNLVDLAPDRVASITLLSAIGVQELELLGSYRLNHLAHGVQLAGLWLLTHGTPHMGALDDVMLNLAYARNFYDSDQRPLRGILMRLETPALVLHGTRDPLVPYAAALEHHRLMPQSELVTFDDGHFRTFTAGADLARIISDFVRRVDDGGMPARAGADPARIAAGQMPFDPAGVPSIGGIGRAVRWMAVAGGIAAVIVMALGARRLRRAVRRPAARTNLNRTPGRP